MASRRTRIKGIANIPQRKKPAVTTEKSESSDTKPEADNSCAINDQNNITAVTKPELTTQEDRIGDISDSIVKVDKEHTVSNECNENAKETCQDSVPKANNLPPSISAPSPVARRKFLKPGINVNVIKRNVKDNSEETLNKNDSPVAPSQVNVKGDILESKQVSHTTPNEKIHVLSEIRIPNPSQAVCNITKIISEPLSNINNTSYSELTLNEASLNANDIPQADNSSLVTFSSVKKFIPEAHVSDSEYPPPPPSPSKINRSRIKAIPKLNLRKTSCSASESEDESRKYGRIRNNSVCSVASTIYLEPPTPTSESAAPKEFLPVAPKKICRTEQSRKLAEARREFYKRFGTKMPDKQKLKMIDLIFYNPVSNPMSQKSNDNKAGDPNIKEKDPEEHADDPVQQGESEKTDKENDADNNLPVPQIKINALGEIVLDEQSLVVENTELAKQKEQIKNSEIVNGDFDTGYGIYKRARRAQSWTQKETLRFYKALNLIGTDFTVMTQLFPKRSRRELKIKFKKEEKINRQLIDKAIMQPCSYNFSDLKREVEVEEEEELFLQKLKEQELQKLKQEKEAKRKRKLKDDNLKEQSAEFADSDQSEADLSCKKRLIESEALTNKANDEESKPKVKKSLNINSVIEDDADADISDLTQSDSDEEEVIPFLKPTRSGRMPKSTIKFIEPEEPPRPHKKRILKKIDHSRFSLKRSRSRDPSPSSLPVGSLRNRRLSSTSSVESNSDRLIPGSVVVTTEEGSNGQADYKVFMVTPLKKLTPLQLESDVVARLVKEKQDVLSPTVQTSETNVTIPAAGVADGLTQK